jgi:hypothetical protein
MRSMVEGAGISAAAGIRPLHRLRRSPSPRFAGEEPSASARALYTPQVAL